MKREDWTILIMGGEVKALTIVLLALGSTVAIQARQGAPHPVKKSPPQILSDSCEGPGHPSQACTDLPDLIYRRNGSPKRVTRKAEDDPGGCILGNEGAFFYKNDKLYVCSNTELIPIDLRLPSAEDKANGWNLPPNGKEQPKKVPKAHLPKSPKRTVATFTNDNAEEITRWQAEDTHRKDLYWSLRTRVLTEQEMDEVRKYGIDLLKHPAPVEGVWMRQELTDTEFRQEFNAALQLQFYIRIAEKD